jgi:hypothetical protein
VLFPSGAGDLFHVLLWRISGWVFDAQGAKLSLAAAFNARIATANMMIRICNRRPPEQ